MSGVQLHRVHSKYWCARDENVAASDLEVAVRAEASLKVGTYVHVKGLEIQVFYFLKRTRTVRGSGSS